MRDERLAARRRRDEPTVGTVEPAEVARRDAGPEVPELGIVGVRLDGARLAISALQARRSRGEQRLAESIRSGAVRAEREASRAQRDGK